MSWTTGVENLRTLLSDGPTDKLRALKSVFGTLDGVNKTFKTFEFRRVTDFSSTATAFPLGLYVNGEWQPPSAIAVDSPETGFFQAATAYSDSTLLTCSYYIQWFTDAELDGFLIRASDWLGLGDDYTIVPTGLKTAALKYAAHEAYQKLSLRWAEAITETYRLQDAPDEKRMQVVEAYQRASKLALDEATKYRDDFYTRKGQALAPRFGTISGNIKNPTVG